MNVKSVCLVSKASGKTIFVEHLLMRKYKHPVIYLMHKEDFKSRGENVEVIIPQDEDGNVDTSMKTLNKWSKKIKEDSINGKTDAFIIDESDLFILKDFRQMQKYPFFHDLVINHRHYGLAMIFITRRPQELPTVITEQSSHYFIFHIAGKNVKDHLNKIHDNLGIIAQNKLSKKKHDFIHLAFGEEVPLRLYSAISIPPEAMVQVSQK